MSAVAMILGILVASAALAWGYSLAGPQMLVRWFLAAGGFWLISEWRRWRWPGSLILLLFIGAAAYGLWIGLLPGLMLIAAVGALLGWDLSIFLQRMRRASPVEDLRSMEMRHIARVTIVSIVSLVIAGISTIVHIRIPFELAVILTLAATLGLTRLVVWIQRENDL